MRHIIVAAIFCVGIGFGVSCQKDAQVCGTCKTVLTDNKTGAVVKEIPSSKTYCDSELDTKKKETPVDLDGQTSKTVCQ